VVVLADRGFELFGAQHWVVLTVFALVGALAVVLGRRLRPPAATRFERTAGALVLVLCAPFELLELVSGIGHWRTDLPVQICDAAWLVAGIALVTRGPRWSAVLYYWGLTLSLQGVVTPHLDQLFPDPRFFGFWARHLSPVWAALYLVGARAGPSWRDYRFVLGVTTLWAVLVLVLNGAYGSNYGFLSRKPASHSLLDLLGPWPWYVVAEAAIVAAGWALITWPWNRRSPPRRPCGPPPG
jgi:hypothetical integral membrane protein (TIGR02206 family)